MLPRDMEIFTIWPKILLATYFYLGLALKSYNANSLNVSPRETFKLFPNCHLKFVYTDIEPVSGRTNYQISSTLGLNISFSAYIIGPITLLGKSCMLRGSSHMKPSRFTQCFLYTCMEDELTENGMAYHHLTSLMEMQQRSFLEYSHHFIFFRKFYSYEESASKFRAKFYREKLNELFAKGLILPVVHDADLTFFYNDFPTLFVSAI